jgi:hypothetical protein
MIDSRLLLEVGVLRPDFLMLSTLGFNVFLEGGGVVAAAVATLGVEVVDVGVGGGVKPIPIMVFSNPTSNPLSATT